MRSWWRSTVASAVAMVVAASVVGAACSSGGGEGASTMVDRSEAIDPPTTTSPVLGIDLESVLGCDDPLRPYRSTWYFGPQPDRLGDCERDGRFVARLAWFPVPADLDEAVSEYERFAHSFQIGGSCPDGTRGFDPATWVVVGPDWLAITIAEDRAREIADATGGRLTASSPTSGPPPSFLLPYEADC